MAEGVSIKVRYPRIDLAATREANHEAMNEFVLETMKVWIRETTTPIPVWSGAARASFLFLAAKAFTSFTINPVVESRITLGITEAESEFFALKDSFYGWSWRTELVHMPFVEDRVGFVKKGLSAIKNSKPKLVQPVTKSVRK